MLALTLPLGLSRDEDALPTVTSNAVRVLGVYCTFSYLREVRHLCTFSSLTPSISHRMRPFSRTVGWLFYMLWPALVSW